MKLIRLLLLGSALICGNTFAAEMVKIEGGSYRPLYLKKETSLIKVKPFQLDKYPVTKCRICRIFENTSTMAKRQNQL